MPYELHEVYVDEKHRCTDDAASPSKLQENRNVGEKEREKVSTFRLALDIEQRIGLQKVFEERILDSRVEFSLWELLGIAKKFLGLD